MCNTLLITQVLKKASHANSINVREHDDEWLKTFDKVTYENKLAATVIIKTIIIIMIKSR